MGQLVKQLQANFGARCDAYAVGGQLYLKFELYGTFKGQNEAQTIDQFNEPVKNFAEMQSVIKKKVPGIFDKITKSPQENCVAEKKIWINGVCKTAEQIAMEDCEAEGKSWTNGACKSRAQIVCEATAGRKWVGEECKTAEQIAALAPPPSFPSSSSKPSSSSQQSVASVISFGELTDTRDGKKYKTVKIGSQTWMAENLNYDASGSKCYENNSANCAKYGRLYDWKTAMKVCPSGWHLPSKSEYEMLDKAVGGENDVAGEKLKAKSGWNKNGNGTDEFEFSALPGGGSGGYFGIAGNYGNWWSSAESSSYSAYYRIMSYNDVNARWNYNGKGYLFSVRCLQD